jgi:hypothetical protein
MTRFYAAAVLAVGCSLAITFCQGEAHLQATFANRKPALL